MKAFRGLYPPLVTPFKANGKLDEKGLRAHIDWMIASGIDGFCTGSSTGEFMNLTREEWEQVLHVSKDQNAGRVPMIAGTADMSTAATVERSKFAEKLGYDGLLIIPPWYQVNTRREIYAHFKAVRNAVGIPIMIYNNPPVTGVDLSFELLVELTRDGIIQYLKDANSDPYVSAKLKMELGDDLNVFYGHDKNALGGFAFGATGWVSGTANFDPVRWSKLTHLCIDKGDFVEARKVWYEIMPFIDLTVPGSNGVRADWIAVIKRGMELRGRPVGGVRAPMLPLTPEVDKKLKAVVKNMTF